MIEIPEAQTVARQIRERLTGRTVTAVFNATHPHKFAWYAGDPLRYKELLTGRKILTASGVAPFIDILLDSDVHMTVGDGTNLHLHAPGDAIPAKYQLLLTFDDDSFLVFTVAMYGALYAYRGCLDNPYFTGAVTKCSPLESAFDADYFGALLETAGQNLSAKAFLATQQRIPGLGNGVLQDILFRARIHPRRKLASLGPDEIRDMYAAVKDVLRKMTECGGRDTEKDLFGNPGRYAVLFSRKTCGGECPACGGPIVREIYLGGAVYYCPVCQPLE